jgi:hypothetical protein
LGRAAQRVFFAGDTATLGSGGGRQRIERGVDREPSHDMGCLGQLPDIVLGGIAPISQALDGPLGELCRHAVEDRASPLTAGVIRHVEALGLRCFELECASHGDAEGVAGPPWEGDRHNAQHNVHAPQRPGFLARGARAIAIAGEPGDMETGFLLGRIVAAHPDDLAGGDSWCCQADDGTPELPAFVIEGTPKENIEAGKVLHGRCSGQPHIGGNGMAIMGHSPATGQGGEGVPRWGGKEIVKQYSDKSTKRRMEKGVHGNVLWQASLSWSMTHLTGAEVAVALHRSHTPLE